MKLIDPITGSIVETATDEATARLVAAGFKPVDKPKRPARKRAAKPKEQ